MTRPNLLWLPRARRVDLSVPRSDSPGTPRGNGIFQTFLGVILHVNVSGKTSQGTPVSAFMAGPPANADYVTPNFQVFRDGSIVQFLPIDWQPWCQIDGNFNYAAIETGGDPDQPLTAAQLHAVAYIVDHYHAHMGMPLQIANAPGQRGIGTHEMGGESWGGHSCPGTIRAAQRDTVIQLVKESDNGMTPAQTEAMIADGLRAAILGGDHGVFTREKYPRLIPDATHGIDNRLHDLEQHDKGTQHPGKHTQKGGGI